MIDRKSTTREMIKMHKAKQAGKGGREMKNGMEELLSNCCGASLYPTTGSEGICKDCKEHCVSVTEEETEFEIEELENSTYPEHMVPGEEIIDIKITVNKLIQWAKETDKQLKEKWN